MSEDPTRTVLRAWRVEGPAPDVHREQKRRLAREWPALYRALLALDVAEKTGRTQRIQHKAASGSLGV